MLHDIRGIEFALKSMVEVKPGQQAEIFPAPLQSLPRHIGVFEHSPPPAIRDGKAREVKRFEL